MRANLARFMRFELNALFTKNRANKGYKLVNINKKTRDEKGLIEGDGFGLKSLEKVENLVCFLCFFTTGKVGK